MREDSLAQGMAAVLEGYYGLLVWCEERGERLIEGIVWEWLAHVEGSVETVVSASYL